MSRPSRPFRTARTIMSRISRTNSPSSAKKKHRRLRLRRRRRPRHCRMARWPSRRLPRPMVRPDSRPCARLASPARNSRALRCSNFLPHSNKRRNSRRRSENLLTTRASHPTSSTRARRMHRLSPLRTRSRMTTPAHLLPRIRWDPVSRRATWSQLLKPLSRRAIRLTTLLPNQTMRSISTRLRVSPMSSMRG